ncbi:hypothetical protein SFRURICE_014818 [Spodoptera frugiperda]|nr:hypothetical protein SFRURICE_014818 [Spodoptera frugiperda]
MRAIDAYYDVCYGWLPYYYYIAYSNSASSSYNYIAYYDGRIKGPTAHWADDVLGGRARWHAATPSSLRIRDVIPTDRAMYRCRVDFKISPTRNHKILLDVIAGKPAYLTVSNRRRRLWLPETPETLQLRF